MLLEQRRQKISDFVSRRGFVPLPELVANLGVSESTVRRDLDYLHETGVLRRTHGGAIALIEPSALPPFEERTGSQVVEKRKIAATAAQLIQDGETVLLDGGTTTFEVARALVGRQVQIVTNSLPIANLFASSREVDLVFIGGVVYPKTGVALGAIACDALSKLFVHHLIMGVHGLNEQGLYNGNLLLVETEQAMMRSSQQTIIVADHSKFGRRGIALIDDWSHIHKLIVDDAVTASQRSMAPANVEVITAGKQELAPQLQESK